MKLVWLKNGIFLLLIPVLFLSACNTTDFRQQQDLCGLILDENNKPVKDFFVEGCDGKRNSFVSYTNESGIFLFENAVLGTYEISGHRKGFTVLENQKIDFNRCGSVFCFQVKSMENQMNLAEEKFKCGNYEGGVREIERIFVEKNSLHEAILLFYKSYGEKKLGNEELAFWDYQKIKEGRWMELVNEEKILGRYLEVFEDE